jgi:WD40 repeat protein
MSETRSRLRHGDELPEEASSDEFVRQLAACDDRLERGTDNAMPLLATLPEMLRADLEPAIDCLRWLNLLRSARADAEAPPAAAEPETPATASTFGRFELRGELGRGGFGVVFRAFDPVLNREVALKLPRPDCLFNAEMRRRFQHEGRAAGNLMHPNIIPVYEAGEVNGICYLASGYCAGTSLAAWLRDRTEPVPPVDAAGVVAGLADGVEYAHAHGILHRDLKPANVLLEPALGDPCVRLARARPAEGPAPRQVDRARINTWPTPKITDFGLAKMADSAGEQTRSGMMLGTAAYMAPEQAEARASAIGSATDVYALGVILYELLTLRRPFVGASDLEVLRQVTSDDPIPVRRLRREIPRDLESICLKCLEKDTQRRYATAGELAADLRRFLRGELAHARTPSQLERLAKWARRRPTVAALVAVSCIAVALSIIAAGWHFHAIESQNQELQKALGDAKDQREIATQRADENAAQYYATQVRVVADTVQGDRIGEASQLLDRLRPKPGTRDLREFCWYYLWRLAANDRWLRGHFHGVSHLAFSPDGRTLASVATDDRGVFLWDVDTGDQRMRLDGFDNFPTRVTISPDGELVVAGSCDIWAKRPTEIRVWSMRTGELLANHFDTATMCSEPAFSHDSTTLAIARCPHGADDLGKVLLWNPKTQEKRWLLADVALASSVVFSPDHATLAVACGPHIQQLRILLLDAASGLVCGEFSGETARARHLAFARDGRTLCSWDHFDRWRVWDLASRRESFSSERLGQRVVQPSFPTRSDRVATVIHDAILWDRPFKVTLRDGPLGPPRFRLFDRGNAVRSIALSADAQTMAIGFNDSKVRLERQSPRPAAHSIAAHTKEAWGVAFAPDSRTLASSGDDHTVRLWDVETRQHVATLDGHESLVFCVAYSKNGCYLATCGYDHDVKLWDAADRRVLASLKGHKDSIRTVAFSPDGRTLASASRDLTIGLWDVPSGTPQGALPGHEQAIHAIAFSPVGKRLVSVGVDRRLILWDVEQRVRIAEIRANGEIRGVAYSADGELIVAAGDDGILRFWDKQLRASRTVIGAHSKAVKCVAFSPDGQTVASGGIDRTVCLWHVPTGQKLLSFTGLAHEVNSVAFSPDGHFLAAALHDGTVMLWPAQP